VARFEDAAAGVSVEVLGQTTSGRYRVRVTRSSAASSGLTAASFAASRAAQITEETAPLPSEIVGWPYGLSSPALPD
jgi:hypothetical protein